MEWQFPIGGPVDLAAELIGRRLMSMDGMIAADVDVRTGRVLTTFDADVTNMDEIIAVIRAAGCFLSNPWPHSSGSTKPVAGRPDLRGYAPEGAA